jgi:outer membrane protein assembly factor BamD (BamD/ComL family)
MVIEKIDATFAAKLYNMADFYRRTKKYDAAVYTYRLLMETYPGSPESRSAQKWLTKMPASALATPHPPEGVGYIPASNTGPARIR